MAISLSIELLRTNVALSALRLGVREGMRSFRPFRYLPDQMLLFPLRGKSFPKTHGPCQGLPEFSHQFEAYLESRYGTDVAEFVLGIPSSLNSQSVVPAIRYAEIAVNLAPESAQAWIAMGASQLRAGQRRGASVSFSRAERSAISWEQVSRVRANQAVLAELEGDNTGAYRLSREAALMLQASPIAICNYREYRKLMRQRGT